ncbi:MAG: hypothetical protein U0325_05185 [Polyangiales bacterium]
MNLRTTLTALSLSLGALSSATAFAQTASFHVSVQPGHFRPMAQPVVVQPAAQPVVVQPVAQPAYVQPAVAPSGCEHPAAQPAYVQPAAQPAYVQPAYVQPGYVQPATQPAYVQTAYGRGFGARRELMRFSYAVQARIAQADQQLRQGVSQGVVSAHAINAFEAQRAQVQGALAMAAQDGVLAPQEQFRLDRMTARLERLDGQFRVLQAPGYRPVAWR